MIGSAPVGRAARACPAEAQPPRSRPAILARVDFSLIILCAYPEPRARSDMQKQGVCFTDSQSATPNLSFPSAA